MKDVGADDAVRGKAEDEDQREADQGARAHAGEAEQEAEDQADDDGRNARCASRKTLWRSRSIAARRNSARKSIETETTNSAIADADQQHVGRVP